MWVLNRDKSLYGEDTVEWRPERWLEYSPEKLQYLGMQRFCFSNKDLLINCVQRLIIWDLDQEVVPALENVRMKFLFSPFPRWVDLLMLCNTDLAQAIYYKMIPMLFSDFEWSFTNPEADKNLQCTFSTRYVGLMMQWKQRKSSK